MSSPSPRPGGAVLMKGKIVDFHGQQVVGMDGPESVITLPTPQEEQEAMIESGKDLSNAPSYQGQYRRGWEAALRWYRDRLGVADGS